MPKQNLAELAKLTRLLILSSTTAAGSGHPTSSLSATDLMVALMFGGVFRADVKNPQHPGNDRLIFSKGHAAPLLYALYTVAGGVPVGELARLRRFGSRLEGHPMPVFPWTEAPTGSLGQGLSVGLGEAEFARLYRLPFRTFVLLGDSEMAEGQVWEAIQLAGVRKTKQLIGMVDCNGLGQTGPTMFGKRADQLAKRVAAFGWKTLVIDGHDLAAIGRVVRQATVAAKRGPVMIVAKTRKGKGVSFLENKLGWHGKALNIEQLHRAEAQFGTVNARLRGKVAKSPRAKLVFGAAKQARVVPRQKALSPREAVGQALVRLAPQFPQLVVLDGEVKNSTFTELFEASYPKRFIQGYIAEQNLVSLAVGLSARGALPVTSTFAAFFTRAADQLRMAAYAGTHQLYIGTHAGVAIGEDGASQMGLEDIALFRSLAQSTVLYPSDAYAAQRLTELALAHTGLVYLRAGRGKQPVLYSTTTKFRIGGSHVLRRSNRDVATIVAAGVTVPEALAAADRLARRHVRVRVIDLYSIKPLDGETLEKAARETKRLIVAEDHRGPGGIAEAVRSALGKLAGRVESLAVQKVPKSGTPAEQMAHQGIDRTAIIQAVEQ